MIRSYCVSLDNLFISWLDDLLHSCHPSLHARLEYLQEALDKAPEKATIEAAYIQEINEQKLDVPEPENEDSQLENDQADSRVILKTDEESDHPRTNRGSFDHDEEYQNAIELTPTRRIKEPLLPKDQLHKRNSSSLN